MSTSYLQKCVINTRHCRAVFISLTDVWQTIRQQQQYPAAVAHLLADLALASGVLVSTLKISGKLIIQCQNEGPIELLVAKATHDHNIQATAKWRQGIVAGDLMPTLNQGSLAVTLMPDHTTEVHQSLVPLAKPTMAEALEDYFQQSEQLPTKLWFSSNQDRAVGLMLQALPGMSPEDEAVFYARAAKLSADFFNDKLLDAALDTGVFRLFPEEDVTIFDPEPVTSECRCGGLPKFQQAIQVLGQKEAEEILAEKPTIEVHCDFCGQTFAFDKKDVSQLFQQH